jgi:LmbE family N-acetylglucosaminyl deacetylase
MTVELVTHLPEVALAIYAHPDDADVACGGVLAKWAKAGCAVHLLICTDGGKGTPDPAISPSELVRIREDELGRAAAIVGVQTFQNLGAADGELERRSSLREELVGWIRRVRPDTVCGHDPTAVFFGQDYVNHVDHRAAGWALLDALSPAAGLPHYFPDAGAPHQPTTAYRSGTLEPDVWVDISDEVDVKAAAVACHRSQFGHAEDGWAEDAVRTRAQYEGRRANVPFAECFRRLRLG